MSVTDDDARTVSMARHPAGWAGGCHLTLVPDLPDDPDDEECVVTGEPELVPCDGAGRPPCFVLPHTRDQRGPRGLCVACGDPQLLDSIGDVAAHDRDDLMTRLVRGDFQVRQR